MTQAQLAQSSQARKAVAPDSFPRWILYFAAGIIAFSLISVGLIRITGNGPDQRAAAPTVQRSLVFEDQKDGGVRVADGVSGQTLTVLYGEQGFVRGALRALARERFARGIGSAQPFDLIARVDGRVTLMDPSTNQRVDLESFGPTNTAEFARFLAMRPE
ncbi:MAG: photosynthetic complex assembly protein PuhC [Limnohabitans sp.]|nr:photosynthetic complex assembly protein PuhC [Limnohabitans sp.]